MNFPTTTLVHFRNLNDWYFLVHESLAGDHYTTQNLIGLETIRSALARKKCQRRTKTPESCWRWAGSLDKTQNTKSKQLFYYLANITYCHVLNRKWWISKKSSCDNLFDGVDSIFKVDNMVHLYSLPYESFHCLWKFVKI